MRICYEMTEMIDIQSPAANNLVRLSYPIVHQIERTMILSEAEGILPSIICSYICYLP